MTHAQCRSDACRQGRMPCPTPYACQAPDDDDGLGAGIFIWSAAGGVLLLVGLIVARIIF